MSPCQTYIDTLRSHGFRITPQREMIVEAIAHQGNHINADEVFALIQERTHSVNIATVYRTLDLLVEQGLASRIDLGEGRVIYAPNQHGTHIHLVCRQCGQVLDADQELLSVLRPTAPIRLSVRCRPAAYLGVGSVQGLPVELERAREEIMIHSPIAMHIPDGFLSVQVSIFFWVISILVIGYALKRVSADLGERQVPLMGVLAAAIFAGQMLNFTVAGGTSGHLIGAALATILLGPWAAMVILTCVISVQALIFQDGGLLVSGHQYLQHGHRRCSCLIHGLSHRALAGRWTVMGYLRQWIYRRLDLSGSGSPRHRS